MSKKYGNYGGDIASVQPSAQQAPGGWNGTELNRQITLDDWPSIISYPFVPAGTVVYGAASGVVNPLVASGTFLIPSGQLLGRTTYSELFTAYGEFFAPGDFSTTFGVPNIVRNFECFLKCSTVSGNTPNIFGSGVLPDHTHSVRVGVGGNAGQSAGGSPPRRDGAGFTFTTSFDGSVGGNAPIRQYLTPIISTTDQLLPVGTVFPALLGSSTIVEDRLPDNTLVCDGSAVNRTTYSGLYTLVGNLYGSGNGSTTFNLPDLRSVFIGNPYPNPVRCSGIILHDVFCGHAHSVGSPTKGPPSSDGGTPFATPGCFAPATTAGTATGIESRPTNFTVLYCLVASPPLS